MPKFQNVFQQCKKKVLTVKLGVILWGLVAYTANAQIEQCFAPGPIPDPPGTVATTSYVATITYDDSDVAFTSPILDLNFHLAINHTWIGDVSATLTSPAGTVVSLIDRPGVPASFFGCAADDTDVLLDDEAVTTAEVQCNGTSPAVGGTQQPNGSLSAFDGETLEGTWTLTVTDHYFEFAGSVLGTSCIDSSTITPVTIGMFEADLRGDRLVTKWQTSSETFNVGFNLWGMTADNDWVPLNKKIIKSKRGDALSTQNYKKTSNLNKFDQEILAVGISSISSTGKEDFFGPFEFDKRYGAEDVPDFIDWKKERDAYTQAMLQAGYVYIKGRYRQLNSRLDSRLQTRAKREQDRQQKFPGVNIMPGEAGLQRITHADLLAAGVDWKGAPAKHIAISLNGEPVSRFVRETNKRNRFTENSDIIFSAAKPKGENQRYIANNIYQLSISHDLASQAATIDFVPQSILVSKHLAQIDIGENKFYASNMIGPEPWLDTELFAVSSTPDTHTVNFSVDESIDPALPARIRLNLLGGIDFPNIDVDGDGSPEPDHHIRLYLNRSDNSEPFWEGYGEGFNLLTIDTQVSGDQLLANASNELTIELIADSGNNLDIMSLDDGTIEYFKRAELNGESVKFSETRTNVQGYQFNSAGITDLGVYAYDSNNHLAKLQTENSEGGFVFSALAGSDLRYEVVNGASAFRQPDMELTPVVSDESLALVDAELVIISDPAFINADLERFAEFHRSELNRPTKIISTYDIYNRYGYSMATPKAINDYLREAAEDIDYSSVLLVGGHTYNYLGYGNQQSSALINSIPGFYADISDVYEQQAPTENPFVDFNGDSIPDKAIGRWPIRNAEQLKNIIDKTIMWHTNGSVAESQSALLIAEADQDQVFKNSIEELVAELGSENDHWSNLTKVYLDDISANQNIPLSGSTVAAQQQIKQAIDLGATLTLFNGHGSPNRWSFQNLVTPGTVSSWDNSTRPTIAIPLACYTSYYETISTNTLAHSMLLADNNAAVAISSAAVLAVEAHNKEFVKRLLIELTQNNRTLGDSVMRVKQDLAAISADYGDIVTSWTTLGDPTLSLHRLPLDEPELPEPEPPLIEQRQKQP